MGAWWATSAGAPRDRRVRPVRRRARGRGRGPASAPAERRRARPASAPAHSPAAILPLGHPLALATLLVAAACIVLVVTYRLVDTDFWQHLAVGRAIWTTRRVPTTQVWAWPTWGAPDVNSSWGFEALVWPFWSLGGVLGLFVWRWLTTLAAFGVLLAVARRLGARGLTAIVVMVWCAVVLRQRVQIRPESLVGVLLALELLILETRRQGGPDRSPWLVPIALVWANVHISWPLGFLILAAFTVEDVWRRRRTVHAAQAAPDAPAPRARRLAAIGLAALAVSFVNPFGWRALWQPFDYFFFLRREPLFRIISELRGIDWTLNGRNGLAVLLLLWPALLLWRMRRRGLDSAELVLCATFTGFALLSQRFLGFYALAAAPYLARDLDEPVRAGRWPRWTEPFAVRAALAALACVAIALPEWRHDDPPNGIGIDDRVFPVAAADFMVREGVRGPGFNQLRSGGYLVWRFWPERDRLPFMDIHQAGTPESRRLYVDALLGEPGWRALDARYRFDWALVSRPPPPGDRLADAIDRDSSWVLVFLDDPAALYVRRTGPLAPLAPRFGYRTLGAGGARLTELAEAAPADPSLRARLRPELERVVATSPATALALSFLANLAMADQRWDAARAALDRALAIDRDTPEAHLRLATIALATGRPAVAIAELGREHARNHAVPNLDLRLGFAYEQLGDRKRAVASYRRELSRSPGNALAAARIHALESGTP